MTTNKITSGAIARTIVLFLALVNQILAMCGIQTIPVAEGDINNLIATVFTIITALVAWWKNNSFTQAAIRGDEVKAALKEGR